MALELKQGTETKVSITNSSKSEKRWIKVFNSLAEAEVGDSSGSKGAIDLKKLKEYLQSESSKKVGRLFILAQHFGVFFCDAGRLRKLGWQVIKSGQNLPPIPG